MSRYALAVVIATLTSIPFVQSEGDRLALRTQGVQALERALHALTLGATSRAAAAASTEKDIPPHDPAPHEVQRPSPTACRSNENA